MSEALGNSLSAKLTKAGANVAADCRVANEGEVPVVFRGSGFRG
jgi:hypothetical protein